MRNYLLAAFILTFSNLAIADELHVDKSKKNQVQFTAKAPSFLSLAPVVGSFDGFTEKIDGYVFWTGDDMKSESEIYFEVDLNSLDTGIGLRNRHMRENYLETDEHAYAKYSAKITKVDKDSTGLLITVKGKMSIHGVERELETIGKVIVDGDSYKVSYVIPLKLSDYKINRGAIFKISDDVKLTLDFHLKKIKKE